MSHPPNHTSRRRGRGIVWGVSLAASFLLGGVVILTQITAYEAMFGTKARPLAALPWLNLAVLAPVAVECLSWVFTVMSVFAVINDKPSGRYERLMWFFAAGAAVVNAWHNVRPDDWLTGLVLGGLSIAGPLIVHFALRWDRDAQSQRTTDDFRQATIARLVFIVRRTVQVVRHPITAWRTISIATNLSVPWELAWRIALLDQYKAVKTVMRAQFERSLPNVHTNELESAPAPSGGVHDEECMDPLIADLLAAHDTGALLEVWSRTEAVHDDSARGASSGNDRAHDTVHGGTGEGVHGVHDDDAQGSARRAQDTVHGSAPKRARNSARPKNKRARQAGEGRAREVVHAHAERQEHIAARHYWDCVRNNIDPRARTRQAIADELSINITAVSRGFKMAEDGSFPDPNGEA